MSFLRSTRRVTCPSVETSLAKVEATSEKTVPPGWSFRHIPGTYQFALFSNSLNNASVSVHCTLPALGAVAHHRKSRSFRLSQQLSWGNRLPFSCHLSNLCRGFPLVLTLRCETRAEQLVVTGARFTRGAEELRQGPEACRDQLTYNGPYLTQTHLADLVIGLEPLSSPLKQVSHEEALFFNSSHCFDNCAHNWYGHHPVHTVRPEVAEAIAQLAASFGVDDELAAYVAKTAQLVEKAERAAWRQQLYDAVLKR